MVQLIVLFHKNTNDLYVMSLGGGKIGRQPTCQPLNYLYILVCLVGNHLLRFVVRFSRRRQSL